MPFISDVLTSIDRPGQVVRNLLTLRPLEAGKHAVDFLGDLLDAVLPGDVIGHIAKPEDYMSGAKMFGMEDAPAILRVPVDLAASIATDPLSYLTFGGAGATAQAAKGLGQIGLKASVAAKATGAAAAAGRAAAQLAKARALSFVSASDDVLSSLSEATRMIVLARKGRLSALEKYKQASQLLQGMKGKIGAAGYHAGDLLDAEKALRAHADRWARISRDAGRAERSALKSVERAGEEAYAAAKSNAAQHEAVTDLLTSLAKKSAPPQARAGAVAESLEAYRKGGMEALAASMRQRPDVFSPGGIGAVGGRTIVSGEEIGKRIAQAGKAIEHVLPASLSNIAKKGASKIGQAWMKTSDWVKDAAGWRFLSINPVTANKIKSSISTGANAAAAGIDEAGRIFQGVDDLHNRFIADVFDNAMYGDGPAKEIIPDFAVEMALSSGKRNGQTAITGAVDEMAILRARASRLASEGGEYAGKINLDRVNKVMERMVEQNHIMWSQLQDALAVGAQNEGRGLYLMRTYKGRTGAAGAAVREMSSPAAMRKRVLRDDESLISFLNDPSNAGIELERDAAKRFASRWDQQGRIITRAKIARDLVGPLADTIDSPGTWDAVSRALQALGKADKNLAAVYDNLINGFTPRNGFFKALHSINRVFKSAAVYGLFLPRISSLVRNEITGGVWQQLSTEGMRQGARELRRGVSNLLDAAGVGVSSLPKMRATDAASSIFKATGRAIEKVMGGPTGLADDIKYIDDAIASAAGDSRLVPDILRQRGKTVLAEAYEHGVLDTFVRSEELLRRLRMSPRMHKVMSAMDMPGVMFNHLESSMRLGLFRDLRHRKVPVAEAARRVREAHLDYNVQSTLNRSMRDIFPFFAFTAQSIPQQGRFLLNNPAIAVGLSTFYARPGDPIMPWMEGRPTVRLGKNQKGETVYVTSLGLPVEALESIPQVSGGVREIGQSIKSSVGNLLHPSLKAAYGYFTGQDMTFGGPYAGYAKTPAIARILGAPDESEAARLYHELKQTGIIQPLVTAEGIASEAVDPDIPIAVRALDSLTGANVVAVDPDKAVAAKIQNELSRDPKARVWRQFYGGSEETEDLIATLRDAQKRLKEKRRNAQLAQE